ncbi:UNVERIFIED_CONTAM: hypothetical protein Slati_1436600 [Sesamum latifolium]|uniref:MULE transposase domain-containing protein n=1 Tax=Sesamum latifolium TaxID=2727402 RepID=A0AAW2X7Q8_9LAMI
MGGLCNFKCSTGDDETVRVGAESEVDAVRGGAESEGDAVRVGAEGDDETVRVGVESESGVEGAERERIEKMKGKRKVSETNFNYADISESEFNDSSDSDYVQPIESDDSDAPSLVFEDIEDSSDEDIFFKNIQKNREVEVEEGEWFSDPGEEEDLDRVPLSEDENECAKHPIFKENNNLKNVELVVGLTFENVQQYREVLRDWSIVGCYWRDGNDNMVPIALVIVPVENRETWTWFVSELLEDIGGLGTNKWSFISDKQKGLIDALKELVPESEHRYCLRHMYQNFKLKFKSQELKEFFWKDASTANKKDFEAFMKNIESLDPKISDDVETESEWLKKVHFQHWARSFFPVYLPGVKDYIQTPYEPLKAPQLKKKRGRPKKLRRRGPDELQNTSTRRGHGNPEEVATQGSQAPPHSQHDAMEEANMNQSQPSPAVQKQPSVSQQKQHVQGDQGTSNVVMSQTSSDQREQVQYQGRRNSELLGKERSSSTNSQAPTVTRSYHKRPTISQVLENIREKAKRRPWKL